MQNKFEGGARQFIPQPETGRKSIPDIQGMEEALDSYAEIRPKLNGTDLYWTYKDYLELESLSPEEQESRYSELLTKITSRIADESGEPNRFKFKEEAVKLMGVSKSRLASFILDSEFPSEAYGYYDVISGRIDVSRQVKLEMKPQLIVEDMVNTGTSFSERVLHHEVIHSYQSERPSSALKKIAKSLLKEILSSIIVTEAFLYATLTANPALIAGAAGLHVLKKKYSAKLYEEIEDEKLLQESQAHIGASRYSYDYVYIPELINRLKKDYELGLKPESEKKLVSAITDIKRLYAMGLRDEGVGDVLKNERWDEKKGRFTNLGDAVDTLKSSLGYSDEDVDTLLKADDLRRQLYLYRASEIAAEELNNAVAELDNNVEKVA